MIHESLSLRSAAKRVSVFVSLTACAAAVASHAQTSSTPSDPIARAVAEAASAFAAEKSTETLWTEAQAGIEAGLTDAQRALAVGRRWLALERLAQARQSMLATQFALRHPAERGDLATFEREWKRLGGTLGSAADGSRLSWRARNGRLSCPQSLRTRPEPVHPPKAPITAGFIAHDRLTLYVESLARD